MDNTSPFLRIAVTGMGLCNALGHDVDQVWSRTLNMESGLTHIPEGGVTPAHFFEAPFSPGLNSYTNVAALCDLNLTRHDLQLPPQDFAGMPASTRLTLHVARQAVESSGIQKAGYDPQRVGVFVSQNAGEAASTLWDLNLTLRAGAIADMAAAHGQWDAKTRDAFHQSLIQGRLQPHEGSMLGRINCMAAGFLCRRYGFAGPAYSMGSACASSMAALYTALQLLRSGVIDAALIGGGEEIYAPLYMAEFAALGALARASEYIREPKDYSRPFDRHRNGFVLGEGAGMLVLEREDTARRRNAPVHGLITGMGSVTTQKGAVEPDAEAQIQAVRLSFAPLDYGPEAVDLVECHATSTVQGDIEEARAMARVFDGKSNPTVLSGYKGQIGHTTGASGVTAIIHGLLSMRDGIYPGTLNCSTPDPALALGEHNLRVCSTPESWEKPASGIRRMQVNSFAFGGACFALQVEEPNDRRMASLHTGAAASSATQDMPAAASADDSRLLYEEVVNGVRLIGLTHQGEEWRMGTTTPHWRQEMTGLPATPSASDLAALARKGMWLHRADAPPPVAVMCCGQGSVWPGMGRALYDNFPAARAAMDRIAAVADWDILALMDEPDVKKIGLTRWQQPYLFLLEYAQASYLESLGFNPVVMSGHSLGELIALCLAEVCTPEQGWNMLNCRAQLMHDLEARATNETGMMAVHGSAEVIAQTLHDFPSLHVSNYNTPTQHILSGPRDALTEARRVLRKQKTPAILLNVSMAFHHPHMRVLREQSLERLNTVAMQPPRMPMISNITTELYPSDAPSIRQYICDLDENSVRWVECVRRMWSDYGIRHFVEFGPTDTMCGLTGDIEPQAVCISAGRKDKEVEGMRQAVAQLHALGHLPRRTAHAVPDNLVSAAEAPVAESAAQPAPSAPAKTVDMPAHVEEILPLLMDATGYERHELAPDMDLRHDLAIRSSRFPMIMSAAESRFQITMRFEDLMGVATIRDLANVIAKLREAPMEDTDDALASAPASSTAAPAPLPPVLRYIPQWAQWAMPDTADLPLVDASPVLVVGHSPLSHAWVESLRSTYGQEQVRVVPSAHEALALLEDTSYTPRGLALDTTALEAALDTDPSQALRQASDLVHAFLSRPTARLCLLAHSLAEQQTLSPLQEGLHALILSVAQAYPTVTCRAVVVESGSQWMRHCLVQTLSVKDTNKGQSGTGDGAGAGDGPILWPVLWRVRDNHYYSPQMQARSLDTSLPGLPLERGQVLVVSGGLCGLTPHALSGLAALGVNLALIGTSPTPSETVQQLGSVVRCYTCDITSKDHTDKTIKEILTDFGRIDGILHAAALNGDGSLASLTALSPHPAESALSVACSGLLHLLEAAAPHGLRYAVAFSSLAGWLGNGEQSQDSAANRAMSALLEQWCTARQLPWRCIGLPPVANDAQPEGSPCPLNTSRLEGAVVADLLTRELCCGASTHVLWARSLPAVPTVLATPAPTAAASRQLAESPLYFPLVFPLGLSHSEGRPQFVGGHHFSRYADQDLQAEHAVLPVTLMLACQEEAARYAQPWLAPVQWENLHFAAPIACSGGLTREGRITAANMPPQSTDLVPVHTQLSVRHVSPTGRRQDRWAEALSATLVMAASSTLPTLPPLAPLWDSPTADLWETCTAPTSNMLHQSQILRLEEIAPQSDSRYAWQWQCLAAFLRQMPQAWVAKSAALLRYTSQSPKGRALLEWRPTENAAHQWRGDVQITHEEGTVFFVIKDLLLVRPEDGSV